MIFSPSKRILSEIEGDAELSKGALGYLTQRSRNAFYDYVLTKFHEAEKAGLTKAKLADRLGLGRDRISKLLATPGNWTLDTATELLAGICREELVPYSVSYVGREPRNFTARDALTIESATSTTRAGITSGSVTILGAPDFGTATSLSPSSPGILKRHAHA